MSAPSGAAIEFASVSYSATPNHAILSDLNLGIRQGEVLILLGPSGSGKTTCLKLVNRLLLPSAGRVYVDGRATDEWDPIRLRRHIGYAIQEVGLFPHYTVWENVALIPKLEGWERQKVQSRVQELLHMMGLPAEQFGKKYPLQLSGGQKQRVGLARALAADPPILLMDEPFGALDPITRTDLQREFKGLQQRLQKTVVFVTHDLSEALMLGNRIALIEAGALRGLYTPREFLNSTEEYARRYVDAFQASLTMFRS